jgi:hypothetical protein
MPTYGRSFPVATPKATPMEAPTRRPALPKLEVKREIMLGKGLCGLVVTPHVMKSARMRPRVPMNSNELAAGAAVIEKAISATAESEGIKIRISSTAASRTRSRLKATTCGGPGFLRKWLTW